MWFEGLCKTGRRADSARREERQVLQDRKKGEFCEMQFEGLCKTGRRMDIARHSLKSFARQGEERVLQDTVQVVCRFCRMQLERQ